MLKPQEFIQSYGDIGATKAKRSSLELFLLGLLAGLILGCAAAAAVTASFSMPNLSLTRFVSSLIFPIGLVVIVFTGSELFTGNCLISISVLEGKASVGGMLRNLLIVYFANFLGCAAVAAVSAFGGAFDNTNLSSAAIMTANAKCSLGFVQAVVLGILCNLMVCLGVVCAGSAKSAPGKAVGAYLPVCLFIICGFEHSIANMYFIPAGLFAMMREDAAGITAANLSWLNFIFRNLVPVTIGNIIGGMGLGALLQYCGRKK